MEEEKKPNKKKLMLVGAFILVFVIGWFGGSEYKAYQVRTAIDEAFSDFPGTSEADSDREGEIMEEIIEENQVIEKQKGDLLEGATMNIKVEKVEEMKQTTREYGSPGVADEGTKFVLVKLTATNTTKAPFDFDVEPLLITNNDVSYTPTSPSSLIDDALRYEELAPNIPKTGYIIYQVPENVNNYSLLSGKSGTDIYYKIKLK